MRNPFRFSNILLMLTIDQLLTAGRIWLRLRLAVILAQGIFL